MERPLFALFNRSHRRRKSWGQFIPRLERLEVRDVPATWTPLTNLIPDSMGGALMILLSDGTVMVQGGSGQEAVTRSWYRLTPNSAGSYIDGTWTELTFMTLARLYYAANVLRDGRVFILG